MRSSGITERRPMCLSSAFLRDSRSASNSSNSWTQRPSRTDNPKISCAETKLFGTATQQHWHRMARRKICSFRMFSGRLLCSARMISNISSLGLASALELETRNKLSILSTLDESWACWSGFMFMMVYSSLFHVFSTNMSWSIIVYQIFRTAHLGISLKGTVGTEGEACPMVVSGIIAIGYLHPPTSFGLRCCVVEMRATTRASWNWI